MHTTRISSLILAAVLVAPIGVAPSRASDHADPMSLNVFAVPRQQEANITDLHAFVVDSDGRTVSVVDPLATDNWLILSLSVRRALEPDQAKTLDLKPYTYRIHLDLAPPVRFAAAQSSELSGAALAAHQRDLSMQELYGGIITHPEDIADTAVLSFNLDLQPREEAEPSVTVELRAAGFLSSESVEPKESVVKLPPTELLLGTSLPSNQIAVTAAVFDDPFIFPRFFRRNVIGVVASIPLKKLALTPRADGSMPILLWATTHKNDTQIDHVGRSLRTQLPRFGYLNDKRPAEQVRAIMRVHDQPTITEALLGSIVSPLFAHRHYDSVPDVMIYDLHKLPVFPNGRWLADDVAEILADDGETLLLELSYAESRQFPRAKTNDKEFFQRFPYLAEPWTEDEVREAADSGTIQRAPDADAIAPPNLDLSIWRRLLWFEIWAIAALTIALILTIRSNRLRFALVVLALLAAPLLYPVYAITVTGMPTAIFEQTATKLQRLGLGLGLIIALGLGFVFALGRRFAKPARAEQSFPRDRQGRIADDARTSTYQEIHRALFDPKESRPYYKSWGSPGESALPVYKTTFASVTADLFALNSKEFAILRAARRTVRSRADLRWGADRNGFRRLVHPMGVCLAGKWKIDASSPKTAYTGYFAPGKEGRVIARYSLGGNHPKGGNNRSLGLAGKLFPLADAASGDTPRAHFITQEDLGGAFTHSIQQAILTNSPPVTLLKRGSGIFAFIPVIAGLGRADAQPSERQLYEIAELEKPKGVPTSCPRFMRLTIVGPLLSHGDDAIDFRDEILGAIYDPGVAQPKRTLVFDIEVSDSGRRTLFQRVVDQEWIRIGSLTFDEAMASYNGDFVVHFHHPPWRRDHNDPDSIQRRDLAAHERRG